MCAEPNAQGYMEISGGLPAWEAARASDHFAPAIIHDFEALRMTSRRTQLPRAELLIGAALVEHRHDLGLCDHVRLHKFLRARVSRQAFRLIADAMGWPSGTGPIYRR